MRNEGPRSSALGHLWQGDDVDIGVGKHGWCGYGSRNMGWYTGRKRGHAEGGKHHRYGGEYCKYSHRRKSCNASIYGKDVSTTDETNDDDLSDASEKMPVMSEFCFC